MLNLTRQKFDRFRKLLLKQRRKVEDELKRVEKEDPIFSDDLVESSEPGTDSWMADVHSRAVAMKESLREMLKWTKNSLVSLKNGKYGKCEKCGKDIEIARLDAIPTATLCVSCSKKSSKK